MAGDTVRVCAAAAIPRNDSSDVYPRRSRLGVHRHRMATREETQAKSEATRLKNLLAKKADKKPLSQLDKAILKRLKAKARKLDNPAAKIAGHEQQV